jgi:hypothetical protein
VIEQPELVVAEGSVLAGALTVGVKAPAAPGPATGQLPRIPADAWGSAGPPSVARPGEIPAVPVSPAPAAAVPVSPAPPSSPARTAAPSANGTASADNGTVPVSPAPWVGRVRVPSAQPARAAPVAPTRPMPLPAVAERRAPRSAYPQRKVKRRGRVRRTVLALFITLLLIAVPVVAGVIAYGLVTGEGFMPDYLQTKLDSYGIHW